MSSVSSRSAVPAASAITVAGPVVGAVLRPGLDKSNLRSGKSHIDAADAERCRGGRGLVLRLGWNCGTLCIYRGCNCETEGRGESDQRALAGEHRRPFFPDRQV